jgi:RimJ/RimL family protein N-acetyltransferase
MNLIDATPAVHLRTVADRDLDTFFDHQADPQAAEMAAVSARDEAEFAAHWAKLLADDTLFVRTIVAEGVVAGSIASWQENGQQLLGYWVGREWWGHGVATQAVGLLLDEVSTRPMHAHVAVHNVGSIRVLEKCAFQRDLLAEAKAPAPSDGVDEFIFVLTARRQQCERPRLVDGYALTSASTRKR